MNLDFWLLYFNVFLYDLVTHNGTGGPGKGQDLAKIVQVIISNSGSPAVVSGAVQEDEQ